ncbi:MAG: MobA/MobL family protein [Limimaricola soesokkakensis]|uniref:MobA/MobL family protein n=1 Tax=Limimaricola soesokkakensis TaxID=1343159 RepID=UPI0040591A36
MAAERHLLSMLHPASRLEVVLHSRADGRSAVKSAAYTARTTYQDARLGRRFSAGKRTGLLSHEIVGWSDGAEALWNAAEAAETRRNARVIRELRPSLPRELPLQEQVRLVRGYCLWLRDRYGVAVQANLHAPRFLSGADEKRLCRGGSERDDEQYLKALFDPDRTNQNFHAHLLMTTRRVCPDTGGFGEKTRELDDRKTGPEELLALRQEWEKRANAALKRLGAEARIDMRSYQAMAEAGDAPEGLVAQDHIGPRRSARSRKKLQKDGVDTTHAGQRRQQIRKNNDELWQNWELLRSLEREKARKEASAEIAAQREAERKQQAESERQRLASARTRDEADAAFARASQFESLRSEDPLHRAISAAFAAPHEFDWPQDEFSEEVDMETFEAPAKPHREPVLQVRVEKVRVRQR